MLPSDPRVYVYHYDRGLALVLGGLSGFFAGAGGLLGGGELRGLGWVLLLVFGPLAALGLWRWLDRRPQLVLGLKGLYYRPFGVNFIPWMEIAGAQLLTVRQSTRLLALELRDEPAFLARCAPKRKPPGWLMRSMGYRTFTVDTGFLDANPYFVADIVRRRARGRR